MALETCQTGSLHLVGLWVGSVKRIYSGYADMTSCMTRSLILHRSADKLYGLWDICDSEHSETLTKYGADAIYWN